MRRRCLLLPLIVLAVLSVLAGCGGSGGGSTALMLPGRVEGRIYAEASILAASATRAGARALQGAQVRVLGTTLSATTQADGAFLLDQVPAGSRTLVVSYPGFQSLSLAVTVPSGSTVSLGDSRLSSASRRWTILVYMNADNDLEQFGVQDVNEMEQVPASDQVAVVVQMDRASGYDATNDNWTDTRRFTITHDTDPQRMTSAAPGVEELGELDMGNPAVLNDFIAWGKAHYPAEHYLLVIWNHGSGWRSRAADEVATDGVSFDDSSGNFIRTEELPAALATSPPLDLVAYDASLMQMLEIAYEMRDTCGYLVGSEESPPGAGYAYQTWLGPLVENPALSPRDLGILMARETLQFYGANSNITHSVIVTDKLDGLAAAVDTFASALIATASASPDGYATARDAAEHFAYGDYKDLYHYAELVKAHIGNAAVTAAAMGVQQAIGEAVIANYHGNAHPDAHGISINVPTPAGYARDAATYTPLALSRATHWDEWLTAQRQ